MSPNTNISPNTWDPSSLRLDQTRLAQLNGRRRRVGQPSPIGDKFIAGPIYVSWVSRAARLGVKALLVGLALWYLRGLRRSNSFIVSNLTMREWGVQPDAKARALRALERVGLIRVERRGKRSPQVTLVVGNPSNSGGTPPEAPKTPKVAYDFQGGSSNNRATINP